jgi:deoxyribodipyrimidine photo-lyase
VVHPRQLIADLDRRDDGHRTFETELAWRDFYADVLFHRPASAWEHYDARFDKIRYDDDGAAIEKFMRWQQGRTGFPIVDAGMRQLLATGWMHNRVRMIVASFLVKDLHLPWTWGARHFLDHLIDGDLASNNHGWQWAAGSGTDAAPYFRVFNPTAQQEKWDPDGEYVHRWVADLDSDSYPGPMVDHAAERLEALDRYEAVKRG